MKKQLITIFIFFFSILVAEEKTDEISEKKIPQKIEENYSVMGDIDFSPYSGAQNLITVHQATERLFNKIIPIKQEKKPIYAILRILELFFVWEPLSQLEMVVQHEVFGHGYRIRDIGSDRVSVDGYRINLPTPYGEGGGATNYCFNTDLTSFQEIAISSGGVEATAILANRLKMKWMETLRLDPKKASLYLQAQLDLTNYVLSMEDSVWFSQTGHDIESYIIWLNNTYYQVELKKEDLKRNVLINFLDPMTYYSIGSYFYYIFTGRDIRIPMISIKNMKFLPNLRLGLAPYGPEYFIESFMSYKNRAIYSYIRFGNHNDNPYLGIGLEYPNLYEFNLNKLGFRADLYYQPIIYSKKGMTIFEDIQVGYTQEELKKRILGLSSYLIYYRKFSKNSNMSIFTEIGYKTDGFVPGFSLKKGAIFRLGIGFSSF